jgi:hypothetical protein
MAYRSGIGGSLGIGQETTWGTQAAADHWLEFDSESMKNNIDRIDSKGMRVNQRLVRTDRWAPGKKGITGDIEYDVITKGSGLMFKHMLGVVNTTPVSGGQKHTFTIGDPFGLGLSVHVNRPDTGGGLRSFHYAGCKVNGWELSNSTDTNLKCKVTLDGVTEVVDGTPGSPTYPVGGAVYSFFQGAITVGGAGTYNIHDWTCTADMGIKTDRYFISGTGGTKKEQIVNALMSLGGTLSTEFTDLTGYNLFLNGTLADVVLTYDTLIVLGTATTYKTVITMKNARFDGDTPNIGSPDVLDWTGNYVLLDDGVNSPVTIDYYTSDTVP